jgi:hypothetical protein
MMWGNGPITWQGAIQGFEEKLDNLVAKVDALADIQGGQLSSVPYGAPGTRAAVLIMRRDSVIYATHVAVRYQNILDAKEALEVLASGNWVFVTPTAASHVIEALNEQSLMLYGDSWIGIDNKGRD